MPSIEQLQAYFMLIVAAIGAFTSALWLSMVIWTFRDMRARSRDPLAHIFATLVVAVLNIPGLIVYLILRPRETLAEGYQRELEDEALLQEIEDRAHCPGCEQPVRDDWQVCPNCYTRLRKQCEHCGKLMQLNWNMCPYCGTAVPGFAPEARRARTPMVQPRAETASLAEESQPAEEPVVEGAGADPESRAPSA